KRADRGAVRLARPEPPVRRLCRPRRPARPGPGGAFRPDLMSAGRPGQGLGAEPRSPARLPPEPIELASTKFTPPRVPAAMVERPRLLSQLDRGAESAVTLVAAPAGAGKTALLSAWAGACDERFVAWFSLEPADGE